MIGPRTGLKVGLRVDPAVGVVSDEISAGGGGAPVLLSIDVTPNAPTWRPTLSTDRQQFTATGTYDIGPPQDITADVTWTSGTPTVGTISNGAGTEGQVTPLLVGTTLITATLGAISGSETLTIAVDIDAASGKGVPSTAFQFTMLGLTLHSGWLAQEASGNLAGFGPSAFTLTANATPLYQQAVAGWTRTASAFNQTVAQRFMAGAGTGPNPASTSVLWLAYYVGQTGPGGQRGVISAGTNVAIGHTNTSNSLRLACVGVNTDDTTTDPVGDDLVHPLILKYDRTNSAVVMYTDEVKTVGTFNSGATDNNKGYGGGPLFTASPPALSGVLYGFVLSGANAELSDAQVKTLLQALGWTVPWS